MDLIDRQAAIENAFEVYTKDYGCIEVVGVDAINELPSAEQQRWIPVTERLPEDETLVLITADDGYIDTDKCFYMDDGSREWCSYNVVAWMPLPKPYKGGAE